MFYDVCIMIVMMLLTVERDQIKSKLGKSNRSCVCVCVCAINRVLLLVYCQ